MAKTINKVKHQFFGRLGVIFVLMASVAAFGQVPHASAVVTTLSGRLLDTNGVAQVGWTVSVEGSGSGTTDATGNFSFSVPSGNLRIGLSPASTNNGTTGPDTVTDSGARFNWDSSEGDPLNMTVPALIDVTVKVQRDGNPIVGASSFGSGWRTSDSFDIVQGQSFYLQSATPDNVVRSTGADGIFHFYSWPKTDLTFGAASVINGVRQTRSITRSITADLPILTIAMPSAPVQMTGRLLDTNNVAQVGWTVNAGNDDGSGQGLTDATGAFSMYVPTGEVRVGLTPPGSNGGTTGPDTVTDSGSSFLWTPSVDGVLNMTIPPMVNVAVKVMQGNNPVVGATTSSSGWNYSTSFDIIPNKPFNLQFASPDWSSHVSDANGVLRFYAWPAASQTINVNNVVNGLTQRGSVTTPITAGMSMVTVQMPPAPVELAGHLLDFDGNPQVGWTVVGGNNDGSGRGVTDENGAFSMYVPTGDVSISLDPAPTQNGLTGPDTVTNSGSSFTWNALEDGDLEMTIPRAVKVTVLVTENGEPVQGARGNSQGWNYSDSFNIRPGTPFSLQFASPDHGSHTTGADGTFSFYSWPRSSIWIGASAQINASNVNGKTYIDTSSGDDTAVRIELGTETSISDYANTPRLTSLSTNVALTPAVFDPNVQAYSVNVPTGTESIDVAATSAEGNVVRIFNANLQDGWNHIAISVTSTGSAFSRVYGIEAYRTPAPPPVDSVPDSSVPDTEAPSNSGANGSDNSGQTETTTKTTLPPPAIDIIKALPVVEAGLTADTSFSSGEAVTVTYGGFQPNEFVQLIVASTPQIIGSGYADANGFVTLTGEIPSSLAGGNHTLAAYAPESGIGFAQPITVTAGLLPTTGSSRNDLLLTWVLMLTVAGILILAIRRRSHALLS